MINKYFYKPQFLGGSRNTEGSKNVEEMKCGSNKTVQGGIEVEGEVPVSMRES